MEYLNWELTVLKRAIGYPSLSTASSNVGMSQPQLSRIVARLEENLDITLLDRSSKRFARWTKAAIELCHAYNEHEEAFFKAVQMLSGGAVPKTITIGSLEGLVSVATELVDSLIKEFNFEKVVFEVLEIQELEERFLSGKLDILLSIHIPGLGKNRRVEIIGAQRVEAYKGDRSILVVSPFENLHRESGSDCTIVSNSLELRRIWIEKMGAKGNIPGEVQKRKATGKDETVQVAGQQTLATKVWDHVEAWVAKR